MLYKLRTLTSMHNDTSNYMMIPIVLGALNFIVQLNGVKPVLGISQFFIDLILCCFYFTKPTHIEDL